VGLCITDGTLALALDRMKTPVEIGQPSSTVTTYTLSASGNAALVGLEDTGLTPA
jgi:hypothetical protein